MCNPLQLKCRIDAPLQPAIRVDISTLLVPPNQIFDTEIDSDHESANSKNNTHSEDAERREKCVVHFLVSRRDQQKVFKADCILSYLAMAQL